MTIRIAILNCYDEPHTLFNFNNETVGEAELLSRRINSFRKVELKIFNVCFDEFPKGKFDAYVISGSDYNPDRDSIAKYDWMRNLLSFIRKTHEKRIPILGICFGHQMVSVAFGAKVFELPETEVGFRKIILEDDGCKSPLYENIPEKFFAVFFHKWAVYKNSLPFGSKLLASSPDIQNQAPSFSYGDTTYAVQFHPERVSKDVKVMFDTHKHLFTKSMRFNYSESSEANLKVLGNFVKKISKKSK